MEDPNPTTKMPMGWNEKFDEQPMRQTLPPPSVREEIALAQGNERCPACKEGYVCAEIATLVRSVLPPEAPSSEPTASHLAVPESKDEDLFEVFYEDPS